MKVDIVRILRMMESLDIWVVGSSSGDARLDVGLCVGDEVGDADTGGSDDNSDMTKMETSK